MRATTGESPSPTRCATATCSVWTTGTTPVSSRFFDESGKATKAEFIVSALFGREIKVIKLDKGTQDFYMRLTTFHSQFRAIGTNYNQCVRALKSNFSEKKALAFLYKLERHTLELVELSKRISALVEEFRSKYPVR